MLPDDLRTHGTICRPLKPLRLEHLFDGRLERFGIREHPESEPEHRLLTNGKWTLSVFPHHDQNHLVGDLVCYYHFPNAPERILDAIAEAFEIDIVSEHQKEFWEFETADELYACEMQRARRDRDYFYAQLIDFFRGEPHGISSVEFGWFMAKMVEHLVLKRPELITPEHKKEIFKAIDKIYERKHIERMLRVDYLVKSGSRDAFCFDVRSGPLTDSDLAALARMLATPESKPGD